MSAAAARPAPGGDAGDSSPQRRKPKGQGKKQPPKARNKKGKRK